MLQRPGLEISGQKYGNVLVVRAHENFGHIAQAAERLFDAIHSHGLTECGRVDKQQCQTGNKRVFRGTASRLIKQSWLGYSPDLIHIKLIGIDQVGIEVQTVDTKHFE